MPKRPEKNFFESVGFAMGRSGYLKHEYYFAPPKGSSIHIVPELSQYRDLFLESS